MELIRKQNQEEQELLHGCKEMKQWDKRTPRMHILTGRSVSTQNIILYHKFPHPLQRSALKPIGKSIQ